MIRGTVTDRDRGRCFIGILAEGRGHLTGPGIDLALQPGTSFFIPAASQHQAYRAAPEAPLSLIKCFPSS